MTIDEFNNIINSISNMSIRVYNIIKDYDENYDNDTKERIANEIDTIYKKRMIEIEKIQNVISKDKLNRSFVENNPIWDNYINKIVAIENSNIEFINKQMKLKKAKLYELNNNKALLLYNPKVKLNYENRII